MKRETITQIILTAALSKSYVKKCAPKVVVLNDYGINLTTLGMQGGGSVEVRGTKALWEELNSLPKEKPIIVAQMGMLGALDVYSPPVLKSYSTADGFLNSLSFTTTVRSSDIGGMVTLNCVMTCLLNDETHKYNNYTRVYATVTVTPIPGD